MISVSSVKVSKTFYVNKYGLTLIVIIIIQT